MSHRISISSKLWLLLLIFSQALAGKRDWENVDSSDLDVFYDARSQSPQESGERQLTAPLFTMGATTSTTTLKYKKDNEDSIEKRTSEPSRRRKKKKNMKPAAASTAMPVDPSQIEQMVKKSLNEIIFAAQLQQQQQQQQQQKEQLQKKKKAVKKEKSEGNRRRKKARLGVEVDELGDLMSNMGLTIEPNEWYKSLPDYPGDDAVSSAVWTFQSAQTFTTFQTAWNFVRQQKERAVDVAAAEGFMATLTKSTRDSFRVPTGGYSIDSHIDGVLFDDRTLRWMVVIDVISEGCESRVGMTRAKVKEYDSLSDAAFVHNELMKITRDRRLTSGITPPVRDDNISLILADFNRYNRLSTDVDDIADKFLRRRNAR